MPVTLTQKWYNSVGQVNSGTHHSTLGIEFEKRSVAEPLFRVSGRLLRKYTLYTGDLYKQLNTSSCLTLILACIIYWQAKEIGRVLSEQLVEAERIDISLARYISPVEWDNVLLYGEYVIDRNLIR